VGSNWRFIFKSLTEWKASVKFPKLTDLRYPPSCNRNYQDIFQNIQAIIYISSYEVLFWDFRLLFSPVLNHYYHWWKCLHSIMFELFLYSIIAHKYFHCWILFDAFIGYWPKFSTFYTEDKYLPRKYSQWCEKHDIFVPCENIIYFYKMFDCNIIPNTSFLSFHQ
jgi:hypothetical protein